MDTKSSVDRKITLLHYLIDVLERKVSFCYDSGHHRSVQDWFHFIELSTTENSFYVLNKTTLREMSAVESFCTYKHQE